MRIEPFTIKVTPEQSKAVQETLFAHGYKWGSGNNEIKYLDEEINYLVFNNICLYVGKSNKFPRLTFKQFEELYMKNISKNTKSVMVCGCCGSDNVKAKAWVNPNQNDDLISITNEIGYCSDCELPSNLETVELNEDAKVIGYQVVGEEGTPLDGQIHPDMQASFCVYSLSQAKKMLNKNITELDNCWKLLAIWNFSIEEPTMMFGRKIVRE